MAASRPNLEINFDRFAPPQFEHLRLFQMNLQIRTAIFTERELQEGPTCRQPGLNLAQLGLDTLTLLLTGLQNCTSDFPHGLFPATSMHAHRTICTFFARTRNHTECTEWIGKLQ